MRRCHGIKKRCKKYTHDGPGFVRYNQFLFNPSDIACHCCRVVWAGLVWLTKDVYSSNSSQSDQNPNKSYWNATFLSKNGLTYPSLRTTFLVRMRSGSDELQGVYYQVADFSHGICRVHCSSSFSGTGLLGKVAILEPGSEK